MNRHEELGMWCARNGEETNEQDDAIRLHRPWAFTVTECTGTPIAGKQGQGRFMLAAAAAHYRMYWIPFPGVKSVKDSAGCC